MQFSYWATIGQTFDEIRAGARFAAKRNFAGSAAAPPARTAATKTPAISLQITA